MSARLSPFATLFLLTIIAFVSPVSAISISVSSGGGGESVSSFDTFDLDDTTALQQNINLEAGSIFKLRQADGSGNNSISESINGNDFSLENNIQSSGTFSTSSSVSANSESGILSQDVAGTGSMSVSVSSAEGSREASQAASVYYGALDSVQAIGAGQGGAYAAQGTGMIGEGGSILSGAAGDENVMGATGTFTGAGLMSANLASFASSETGRATSDGAASLDGVTLIDSGSFEAVSSQSLEMGLEGLRDVGDGSVGGFDLNVLNLEQAEKESAAATSTNAAATAGGSYSSYVLTGYRWNQNNPQVQLYLNPKNAPSGITESETQSAVAAAANTWDDAVSSNLFADGATVIIDNSKTVDNPFSSTPVSDGSNVVGWANMGSSYLGMCRWWSNGATKGGYKSILEADTWFASDKTWTTDLSKATGSTFDIQSVAVHELGHTIGLGDLYTLPSSDSRKYDWNQVMNSYDGAQRTLGNGDLTGAQALYGSMFPSLDAFQVTSYTPWQGYWTGIGTWLTGDFNGDGKDDLAHVQGDSTHQSFDFVNIWESNGDGTFEIKAYSPQQNYLAGIGSWQMGDYNGDGKDDLVHVMGDSAHQSLDYVDIWESKGDGTFEVNPFSPWQGYWTGIGTWLEGDYNGDGKTDLAHVQGDSTHQSFDFVDIWESNGDGSYAINAYSPWKGYWTGIGTWLEGDYDGDGKDDLAHVQGDSTHQSFDYVNFWESNGDGTFEIRAYAPASGYSAGIGSWLSSDINGDNKKDLIHILGDQNQQSIDYVNLWISSNGATDIKSYSPWSSYLTGIGSWQIGDYNGDGKEDIVHIQGDKIRPSMDYTNAWTAK